MAFSSFLSRQIEHDADRYEMALAGSKVFEATTIRMHVLAKALDRTYEKLRVTWKKDRRLPDHFPTLLLDQEAQLSGYVRAWRENALVEGKTGLLDTHPSPADRIRRARRANQPWLFDLEGPAAALFADFDAVSRQVTFLHDTDDLGMPPLPALVGAAGHS